MDEISFVATGFVTARQKGPLTITLVRNDNLVVVEVAFGSVGVFAQLTAGAAVDEVLRKLSSFQKVETQIPLAGVRSIDGIEGQNGMTFEYTDSGGRNRRKTTHISDSEAREQLVRHLEARAGHAFQKTEEFAGVWRMAWSQLLGAVVSILLTVIVVVFWNPQAWARVRGGWLALWLGPTGCVFVGFCFLVGCLVSAWWRIRRWPSLYRWYV